MKVFMLSGFFSIFWAMIFLLLGKFFDRFMPHILSTILSSLLTSFGNFYIQYSLFMETNVLFHHAVIYACLAVVETITISFVANTLISNKKEIYDKLEIYEHKIKKLWNEYFNTAARSLAGFICFVAVSYPLRKYWVFK